MRALIVCTVLALLGAATPYGTEVVWHYDRHTGRAWTEATTPDGCNVATCEHESKRIADGGVLADMEEVSCIVTSRICRSKIWVALLPDGGTDGLREESVVEDGGPPRECKGLCCFEHCVEAAPTWQIPNVIYTPGQYTVPAVVHLNGGG